MNVQVLCIQLQRRRTYWERKTLLFRFRFKTCIFFKAKREVTYNDDIHVINLLKDDVKVGFIALEQNDNKMNISAIEVNKKNRNEGIAESALRQLPTYIRKQFEDIEVLSITLYGERNELKPLCLNSNFVAIEETEDYTRFEKYINY